MQPSEDHSLAEPMSSTYPLMPPPSSVQSAPGRSGARQTYLDLAESSHINPSVLHSENSRSRNTSNQEEAPPTDLRSALMSQVRRIIMVDTQGKPTGRFIIDDEHLGDVLIWAAHYGAAQRLRDVEKRLEMGLPIRSDRIPYTPSATSARTQGPLAIDPSNRLAASAFRGALHGDTSNPHNASSQRAFIDTSKPIPPPGSITFDQLKMDSDMSTDQPSGDHEELREHPEDFFMIESRSDSLQD